MTRVTLTLFAPDGAELYTETYDPATSLFQDALIRSGIPEVVALVRQSYAPDGEGWQGPVGSYKARLTYGGYTVVIAKQERQLGLPLFMSRRSPELREELGL